MLAVWTRVVHRVRATRPELAAVLNHAVPKEVSSDQVVVAYSQRSVFTNAAQHKETLEALEVAARQELGRAPRIHIELGEARGETVSEVEARRREAERRAAIDRARNHPLVLEAQRVLGARVKRVLPYE